MKRSRIKKICLFRIFRDSAQKLSMVFPEPLPKLLGELSIENNQWELVKMEKEG